MRAHWRRTSVVAIADVQADVGSSDMVANLQAIALIMR